jgi:hypothetical protein
VSFAEKTQTKSGPASTSITQQRRHFRLQDFVGFFFDISTRDEQSLLMAKEEKFLCQ